MEYPEEPYSTTGEARSMADSRPIVLHRGPGHSVGIEAFIQAQGWTVVAYVDEVSPDGAATAEGVPIVPFATWRERMREVPSLVTVLDPFERRAIADRIHAAGGRIAATEITGTAVSRHTTFGEGMLVGRGALYLGSLTTIGRHTIIMTPASIGHDCVIGAFVTIYPSAVVSGYVVIDDDVTIGVGAVIVNGRPAQPLRIGRGARILAGAVVTTSVRAGAVIAGNPGRPERHSQPAVAHTYSPTDR